MLSHVKVCVNRIQARDRYEVAFVSLFHVYMGCQMVRMGVNEDSLTRVCAWVILCVLHVCKCV